MPLPTDPIVDAIRRSPLRQVARAVYRCLLSVLRRVGYRQSAARLAADAQRYWERHAPDSPNTSHWRGEGGLTDEQFEEMGRRNADRVAMAARALAFPTSELRILEWGCGGGTNLAALTGHAAHLIGIEVTEDSLRRTAEELHRRSPDVPFTPIRIDVTEPGRALAELDEPVDLLLCVNVMEVTPTPAYGLELIELFHDLLRPGGMALVQIRYQDHRASSRPAGAFYRANLADMTSYPIPEFWTACGVRGLHPKLLTIEPHEDVIGTRYAYLVLTRDELDPAPGS